MIQIVIPAYNEQDRLPSTLRDLRRYVHEVRPTIGPVEVIVVDNASTDATRSVAEAADSLALPVRVVECRTPGKGAAVRAGVGASTADVVAFMDADGATRLDALEQAWRHLALGADIAIGSRAVAGSVTSARTRRLRERGAQLYRACAAGVVPGIRDTQCGFKVFDGALARSLFAELRTVGFAFDVEVLARAQAVGACIVELPVVWVDVPGSTFDPVRHGPSSFAAVASVAWRVRRRPATVPVTALAPAAAPTRERGIGPVAIGAAVAAVAAVIIEG